MSSVPPFDFVAMLPLLLLSLTGMGVMLMGALRRDETGAVTRPLTLASLVVSALALLPLLGDSGRPLFLVGPPGAPTAFGMLQMNSFAAVCGITVLLAVIVVVLLSKDYVVRHGIIATEYYSLLLFAALGMVLLGAATDLVAILLALELLSVCLYVMTGMERANPRSLEAALKYFILGSFASAFLIFGMAFIYGATAHTQLALISQAVREGNYIPQFLVAGFALLLVGFGFKLALAPFHMWAPDVYDGAPTPITALIATASKVAGFAAMLHVVVGLHEFIRVTPMAVSVLWTVAVLSMVLGNLLGIVQKGIKRMLAYSSIAHSGYLAIAILVAGLAGADGDSLGAATGAIVFYLIGYAFMNLLAFGIATVLGRRGDTLLDHYAGLSKREPLLAALMSIAMLALTGIPLTAGFVGKFLVFATAVKQEMAMLAVLGMLSSVISAYYYLRVIVLMYFYEPADGAEFEPVPASSRAPLIACAVAVVLLGVVPWPFIQLAGGLLAAAL